MRYSRAAVIPPHSISNVSRQNTPHTSSRAHYSQVIRCGGRPVVCNRSIQADVEEWVESGEDAEPPAKAETDVRRVVEGPEGEQLREGREGLGRAARFDGEGCYREAEQNDEGGDADGPSWSLSDETRNEK